MKNVKMLLNEKLNGVELYFEGKPSKEVRDTLKANKFRWNRKKYCWYAKQNNETLALAKQLSNGIKQDNKTSTKQSTISLYDRVRAKHDKNLVNDFKMTKEVTAKTRQYVKKAYPEIKISGRTSGKSIYITIKSGIFEYIDFDQFYNDNKNHPKYSNLSTNQARMSMARDWKDTENLILNSIKKDIENYILQYNFDESDSQVDYFHTNFYFSVDIDCDYKQVEATKQQLKDIKDFYNRIEQEKQAQREKEEREFQEYLQKQAEEKARQKELEKQREIEKDIFLKDAEITEVEDSYIIKNLTAGISKANDLADAKDYLKYMLEEFGQDEGRADVEIVKEIRVNDPQAYNYIKTTLLGDLGILKGIGGSKTIDNRVNHTLDYRYMDDHERKTVEFYNIGIAIYYNDELKFVINPEGFDYARYTYLVTKDTEKVKELNYKQKLKGQKLEELKRQAEDLEKLKLENVEDKHNKILNSGLNLNKQIIQQVTDYDKKDILYTLLYSNKPQNEQVKELEKYKGKDITIIKSGVFSPDIHVMKLKDIVVNNYIRLIDSNDKVISIDFNDKVLIYENQLNLPKQWYFERKQEGEFTSETGLFGSFDSKMMIVTYDNLLKENKRPIYNTIYYNAI